MNGARQLYLNIYYVIHNIDHYLKNFRMLYQGHKYWHSPTVHGKALAILIAYDIYLECAKGKLNESLKVEQPMSFWEICDRLSSQMCTYKPLN
eukprot:9122862-Ditylum_brightwellii.AAC.1